MLIMYIALAWESKAILNLKMFCVDQGCGSG